MKKILSFLLLFIYFVVSSGFAVNMHYCMDKISSVEIGMGKGDTCDKCGMKKSSSHGCCRDEVKLVQLHQDLAPAQYVVVDFSISPVILSTVHHIVAPFYNFTTGATSLHLQPPLLSGQDACITNCVFRI